MKERITKNVNDWYLTSNDEGMSYNPSMNCGLKDKEKGLFVVYDLTDKNFSVCIINEEGDFDDEAVELFEGFEIKELINNLVEKTNESYFNIKTVLYDFLKIIKYAIKE